MVEKFCQLFQDRNRVPHPDRMLPAFHQVVEQILDIGQVEVPGDNQVPGLPIALPDKRMDVLDIVLAESPVTQMAEEQLPAERQVGLDPIHVRKLFLLPLEPAFNLGERPLEDILDRRGRVGPPHVGVSRSWRHAELDVHHPGPVLAPVVLFFHQQVHAVQTIQAVTVFFLVVRDGFAEPEKGNAAFVFYVLAHGDIL